MEEKMQQDCEPEMYTKEEMSAVEAHIEKYFGKILNVFHEIFSPDIHVDICIIPPEEERDYYILSTMGMGAHCMNVPEELAEYKLERAELLIALPPDWELNEESIQDERWYWPIRLLKSTARLPGECDTWLGWGHTVGTEEGETYAENTKLCGVLLIDPVLSQEEGASTCTLPNGEEVCFYQLIPLYREEMGYKCENDAEALLDKMEDVSFVVDINRPNVIKDWDKEEDGFHMTLKLNARLQPRDRHGLEDVIQEMLEERKMGNVDGGGSMQLPSGEIKFCDIEIYLKDGSQESIQALRDVINQLNIPKGSELQAEDFCIPVGEQEGLALYLNETELPDEVYESCDINYVVEQMEALMEGIGKMYSFWEGPEDTGLYFYGTSYEKMKAAVQGFLEEYPLCRKCVVVQIA